MPLSVREFDARLNARFLLHTAGGRRRRPGTTLWCINSSERLASRNGRVQLPRKQPSRRTTSAIQIMSNTARSLDISKKGGSRCNGSASTVRARRGTHVEAQGRHLSGVRVPPPPLPPIRHRRRYLRFIQWPRLKGYRSRGKRFYFDNTFIGDACSGPNKSPTAARRGFVTPIAPPSPSISKKIMCNIWKKRSECANVGGVSSWSKDGAPVRKGCVINAQMGT